MQMRLITRFLLIWMTFALVFSGCALFEGSPDVEIKPIHRECLMGLRYVKFSDKTWEWLTMNSPPDYVIQDLGKVAKNNKILATRCDNISRPPDE